MYLYFECQHPVLDTSSFRNHTRFQAFLAGASFQVSGVRRPKCDCTGRVATVPPENSEQPKGRSYSSKRTAKVDGLADPCLNQVNQIRCDAHLCASTLWTRKSERQYGQGLILARSGSPSFAAVVQSADLRLRHDRSHFRRLSRSRLG